MSEAIYQKLARHLDRLPGGFPATPDGLELRILRRLFTPQQAALALQLTLIPTSAQGIARRAGLDAADTAQMLAEMAEKGLISDTVAKGKNGAGGRVSYSAAQFVVGIWEFQVNRLDEELVRLVDEYLPTLFNPQAWQKAPQLRTIPVNESLQAPASVLAYHNAEQIVQSHQRFAVQPCICRQEKDLLGESCGKPQEVCLSMDGAADFLLRHQRGREISKEEALGVLRLANDAGLVIQPGNTRDPNYLCCCCGDCCGILRTAKLHPRPADLLSSAYQAACTEDLCASCGACMERCQMDAIDLETGYAVVDLARCIGCGLCVSTCPTGALTLAPRGEAGKARVPANNIELYLKHAWARGAMPPGEIAGLLARTVVDKLRGG